MTRSSKRLRRSISTTEPLATADCRLKIHELAIGDWGFTDLRLAIEGDVAEIATFIAIRRHTALKLA